MIGAIIGDIAGSTYEFSNTLDYNFDFFPQGCSFTDDSVCTIAVADAILKGVSYRDSLVHWCRKYPNPMGAYGCSFSRWIRSENPQPYGSYGNGAAMRVSPTGWAFSSAEEVEEEAAKSAECTHSHPEGIKGAQAIALAIFNIRNKIWKNPLEDARLHCLKIYGDDYLERIPKEGEWNETCQGCVPLALHLFSQSSDFEDAVRRAVSYGGDSDTLGAIVGSLAEACYGVPTEIAIKALSLLPTEMICVLSDFETNFNPESEVCKLLR